MVSLSHELLLKIWKHGEEAYPEEGAGLLLGHLDDETRFVERIIPLQNTFAAEQRHHRYMITPADVILAEDQSEEMGLEVLIGERAGSGFCSLLLIEQQDKTYKMVPTKNGPRPVLPIFKLAEIPDKLGSKMKLDPSEATLEGSVFGVLEQTP